MNARTYIHSLPDSPIVLDPNAYTLLDSINNKQEYETSKLSLSALADFTILSYTYTEFFKDSEEANTWVNLNSSVLLVDSFKVGSTSLNVQYDPIKFLSNINYPYSIIVQNVNENNLASSELSFQNDTISNKLSIGILNSNYFNPLWTIGNSGDGFIYTTDANLQIGTKYNNDIILYTNGSFLGNERLVVKNDGKIGIGTKTPLSELSVVGTLSTNNILIDSENNSNTWKNTSTFVARTSTNQLNTSNFVNSNSANLIYRTGGILNGPLLTTKTNVNAFLTNELVSKRYADSLALQATISGNFIPSLYYDQTQIDDFLLKPNESYSYLNSNSSFDTESRNFTNLNSSNLIQNINVLQSLSADWNSVYSYTNQFSSLEDNQQQITSFIFKTSSNYIDTSNFVNTNSSNILDLNSLFNKLSVDYNSGYSYLNQNSSLELESRTFVNNSSSYLIDLNTTTTQTSSRWYAAYTYTRNFSAKIQETNTYTQETSAIVNNFIDEVNFEKPKWNSVYSNVNSNSASYAKTIDVNSKFLPTTGGLINGDLKISGCFYSDTFGVGNFQSASTLGTLIGKIEVFNSNKISIGFLPIYNNIS